MMLLSIHFDWSKADASGSDENCLEMTVPAPSSTFGDGCPHDINSHLRRSFFWGGGYEL